MARMELPYGKGTVLVDVPDRNLAATLEGSSAPEVSLEEEFARAWAHPIGTADPAKIIRSGEKLVFVVTDHTRPTPTAKLLLLIWERLCSHVRAEDVTVIVATGTHRRSSEEELDGMFGSLRRQFRFAFHDCDQDLVLAGNSRRGTPILLDRVVAEADRVVTIGHIGMHYYAGYSGGRKNILPGVRCVYQGNPISEEMVEAARLARVDFIVDVVLDAKGRVAKVVVGDLEEAHAAGRAFWDSLFQVKVRDKSDVVVVSAGGHPKDIDLYQAYKALYNAGKAVRDGGIVLLAAACPDGIGNQVFTDWVMRCRKPDDVFEVLRQEGFRLGGHKAVYLAKDLAHSDVYLLSELDDALVRRFFLNPARGAEEVMAVARERFGDDFRVFVMPHGADTVPVVQEREAERVAARL